MKITTFDILSYKIPMVAPLTMKGLETHHREGLFVRLSDDDGRIGWGEISPLPGFSPESMNEITEQTRKLKYRLKGTVAPEHLEELSGGFERWLRDFDLSASVRCGFETAVLNLIAATRNCPLSEILADTSAKTIAVNALLSGPDDKVIAKAKESAQVGYKTVKLKVGRRSIDDDIVLARRVRETVGGWVALRLDANRAWEMDEAVTFAAGVKPLAVEYIEEPLIDPKGLAEFHKRTGVPFALDETLRENTPENIDLPEGAAAVILKPTLLGGFEISMRFARRARRKDIKSVVSSSFETPSGLHVLAQLAAALGEADTAHGLGTAGRFAAEISDIPFGITDGTVKIIRVKQSLSPVKPEFLEEINNDR